MGVIDKAVNWALSIANDNKHGYDQTNRWGPDYDCSSLVISAFEQAGAKVKTAGATYTGNMKNAFLKCGFKDVTSSINRSTGAGLIRGDVLLNIKSHTALYLGNGKIVHAAGNENGRATGGKTGDQTGGEICERSYYNSPWDCILRYTGENAKTTSSTASIIYGTPTETMKTELPLLRKGHKGKAVSTLQTLLVWHGYKVDVDGYFGNDTEKTVVLFQTANGLDADGEVGAQSWKALING